MDKRGKRSNKREKAFDVGIAVEANRTPPRVERRVKVKDTSVEVGIWHGGNDEAQDA